MASPSASSDSEGPGDEPITLTASADVILDVTPVGSSNEEESEAVAAVAKRGRYNEEAFSSSSEEEDNDEYESTSAYTSSVEPSSEWDKALRTGKHSKGHASDFFTSHSQSFDHESETAASEPPPPPPGDAASFPSQSTKTTSNGSAGLVSTMRPHPADDHLSSGVLPDVLMSMRQHLESLTLFDSDMMKLAADQVDDYNKETRESLKRSSQQSISAAVLVSLAHKRYERRRLAAMEIEKVVRSLVQQNEIERVRAILLLLSDDYVRSTSEDARKGGVVALAACAIGLKKAPEEQTNVQECKDLILASVVHACQDHSQRVRYYATESLFNVVKVIPAMAVQHFFILFEILRSLYADVDADVRSGAELLDKKLKEVIVSAMNAGTFTAEACVPVFARFVYIRNKATKRLTLTWLQELNEKLIASPILEFLHLFLGGIFDMVADPTVAIRQSALAFLHSVLPKLLVVNSEPIENTGSKGMHVDFDKILQSLVTTMEHPDPFVRKVAMYWMSRIVKAHLSDPKVIAGDAAEKKTETPEALTDASVSVRNSLPHILPGILLSIGDDYHVSNSAKEKDSFLPDQTTPALAEQTNMVLQEAVRRDGQGYVQHLDGFIVALREELDSPGGLNSRYPAASERSPYRMDVKQDGTGIESPGWFSSSADNAERKEKPMVNSRLCALDWVIVLYESVVPVMLKADYAREFVFAIIHQLVDNPPESIVYKSLEVLAKITVPVAGEDVSRSLSAASLSGLTTPSWLGGESVDESNAEFPMTEANISFAFDILEPSRRLLMSRNREVFSALILLYAHNEALISDLSKVISYMCKLQPPEFIYVSFAVELDRYLRRSAESKPKYSRDLKFVSSFIQHMSHVLLNAEEAKYIRDVLRDCVCSQTKSERGRQRSRLFHILLHTFSHNLPATISLCFWAGAYRTTNLFLNDINPLDINLVFFLEIDRFVEMLERPLFRHLHIRMLEYDKDPEHEGSGFMLFKALKSLLMLLPQSTCYFVLKDRLTSVSRFRQSTIRMNLRQREADLRPLNVFLDRVQAVRAIHCAAVWSTIRAESLEIPVVQEERTKEEGADRREWLGYASKQEEKDAKEEYLRQKNRQSEDLVTIEEANEYSDLAVEPPVESKTFQVEAPDELGATSTTIHEGEEPKWKKFWEDTDV